MDPARPLRFLIVDDSSAMRSLIRTILQAHFNVTQVFEAAEAGEALTRFITCEIDIVITDIAMQPGDGLQLIESIRAIGDPERRRIPIIAVTGFSTKRMVEQLRDLGVHEVLTKPVTIRTLCDRVRAVLDKPRDFVEGGTYFGPDRRRRTREAHVGPERRAALLLQDEIEEATEPEAP